MEAAVVDVDIICAVAVGDDEDSMKFEMIATSCCSSLLLLLAVLDAPLLLLLLQPSIMSSIERIRFLAAIWRCQSTSHDITSDVIAVKCLARPITAHDNSFSSVRRPEVARTALPLNAHA
jgi:hypothetical protein